MLEQPNFEDSSAVGEWIKSSIQVDKASKHIKGHYYQWLRDNHCASSATLHRAHYKVYAIARHSARKYVQGTELNKSLNFMRGAYSTLSRALNTGIPVAGVGKSALEQRIKARKEVKLRTPGEMIRRSFTSLQGAHEAVKNNFKLDRTDISRLQSIRARAHMILAAVGETDE